MNPLQKKVEKIKCCNAGRGMRRVTARGPEDSSPRHPLPRTRGRGGGRGWSLRVGARPWLRRQKRVSACRRCPCALFRGKNFILFRSIDKDAIQRTCGSKLNLKHT
jgi:hypothetical protein